MRGTNEEVYTYTYDDILPILPIIHITGSATLINRVLQRVPERKSDLLDNMITWPDNMDTSKWYYLAVQEATNSHDYNRKKNGYEYWTELRKNRDWVALER